MKGELDVRIRPSVEEDTPSILDLMQISLGTSAIPRTAEYWSWKHCENPFGVSPALVAESDGRLVGLRVFIKWGWITGGIEVPAVRSVDTATHPEWQGRGIFTRLTLALVNKVESDGVGLVFNTPNTRSRPGYLKMGWTSLGRANIWVRPGTIRGLLSGIAGKARTFNEQNSGIERSWPSLEDQIDDSDVERLSNPRQKDTRLSTRLSREYLKWRYVQIPGFKYYGVSERNRDGEVLIVFRARRNRRLLELRLCEVLVSAEPSALRLAEQSIGALIKSLRPSVVTAMASRRSAERNALRRAGFVSAPSIGPVLTVRPLAGMPQSIGALTWSDWRTSIGDLELF